MAIGTIRILVELTPDGKINTRYLDGDDGTTAIPLLWTAIPPYSVPAGTSFSVNIRTTYLDEPGTPDATISVVGTLPTGWSFDGTTLSYAGAAVASALIRFSATRLGFTAESTEFLLESYAVAVSDTTAPTVPTGVTVVNGDGQVTVSWDASTDPYTTTAGSGIDSYDIQLNGGGTMNVAAPAASLSLPYTLYNIGSNGVTPTSSQSGSDWSMTASGDVDGAADLVALNGAQISGDFFMTTKIESITNTTDFTKAGLACRDSTADNAPAFYFHVQKAADGSMELQARARSISGGNVGSVAITALTALPVWLRYSRVGNTHTAEYSSDGNAFTALVTSYSLPMATSVYGGLYLVSTHPTTTATAQFRQFSLNNAARVSAIYVTASSGNITVRAKDESGNNSSYSANVAAAPTAPPSVAIKWNPGVYVDSGNYRCTSTKIADDYAVITEIGSMPNVKGLHLRTTWDCLEGATAGDYTAGFALIDEYLTRLAAAGNKRLILQVWPMGYGACTATNSTGGVYTGGVYLPSYIKNNTSYMDYCYSNQRLWSARLWDPAVADRVNALSAAYGARYNGHPLFEMWEIHEETIGMIGNTSANFSWSAAETQWNRMIEAAKTAFPNTLVHDPVNYMQNDTMVFNQLNEHTEPGLIYGTCDTLLDTNRKIPGQLIWRGLNSDGTDNAAWPDRRSEPWVARAMWGPLYRQQTLTETHDYARNTMQCRYFVPWRQTWYVGGGAGQTKWPEVKAFINAGSATVYSTACPTGWTCTTGGV